MIVIHFFAVYFRVRKKVKKGAQNTLNFPLFSPNDHIEILSSFF